MEIGVAFLGDSDTGTLLDCARELDDHPLISTLWVADERFLRDPWVQLGALATVTKRARLGICVTDPYIRYPALTASAAATLQELSGGRAILGLGAGSTGFSALGVKPQGQADATRECIEFCRRFWSERSPFSYQGRHVAFHDDSLQFSPPIAIPIYVAARGPRMLATAAQHADAVLLGNFVQGPGLDYALNAVRSGGARRSGLGPLRLASWIYFSVGEPREARRAAARGLALALSSSHQLFTRIGYELPTSITDLVSNRAHRLTSEAVDHLVSMMPENLIDDFTVAGDADTCIRKLRVLREHGVEEIAILPFAPAGSNARDVVQRLLNEVAPALLAEPTGTVALPSTAGKPGIQLLIDGPVASIIVNRPAVRNALDLATWEQLTVALDSVASQFRRVRVLLLRGAGGKAFVAGADISELGQVASNPDSRRRYVELVESVMKKLERLPQPVIAVVSGDAVGAGLELMAASDLRIACAGARIGIPAAKLGLAVTRQDLSRLERLVGIGRVKWLMMTGSLVSAETAMTWGLVDSVHGQDSFEEAVANLATEVAFNSALTHRLTKRALLAQWDSALHSDEEGFAYSLPAWSSRSLQEGLGAFRERRRADFPTAEVRDLK